MRIFLESLILSVLFCVLLIAITFVCTHIDFVIYEMNTLLLVCMLSVFPAFVFCYLGYKIDRIKHKVSIPLSFIFSTLCGLGYYIYDLNSDEFFAGLSILFILPMAILGNVIAWSYHLYQCKKKHILSK